MNTPVSFEIAKLLKEKGFDEPCFKGWDLSEEDTKPTFHEYTTLNKNSDYIETFYTAPTIAEVVMWLYEKHGIWIQAPFSHNDAKPFCWVINTTIRNISEEDENRNCWLSGIDCNNVYGFDSPTEAYEAAINHTLNNLL